ncbi:MAG: oxygen-insensitive NADPH nitroreductase [Gammaproteobacteria bacterium]|nr:MAG: oxygen-insensitive NADPH nitroreductase [Gammaproteobacteria bacterium]
MSPNPVHDLIRRHSSVRQYTDAPIDEDLLKEIVCCGQAASSSSFIQAYSLVRVCNHDKRKTIAEAAGGQAWVAAAPEFLVICADLQRVAYACRKADAGELEGWTEHFITATVDAALMAQNMMLAAEAAGLGGVFIGGIRNDPTTVAELLALPKQVYPVFGLCLGWPAQRNPVKPRFPVEAIVHTDRYDAQGVPGYVDAYDQTMMDYYRTRDSNARQSDWSTQTAAAVQGKKRQHMLGFLQARGFLKR